MKSPWIYITFTILIVLAVLSYVFHWQGEGIFAYWPFLLVFLCPLMMFGMHGGHDGDHSRPKDKAPEEDATSHKH